MHESSLEIAESLARHGQILLSIQGLRMQRTEDALAGDKDLLLDLARFGPLPHLVKKAGEVMSVLQGVRVIRPFVTFIYF